MVSVHPPHHPPLHSTPLDASSHVLYTIHIAQDFWLGILSIWRSVWSCSRIRRNVRIGVPIVGVEWTGVKWSGVALLHPHHHHPLLPGGLTRWD